MDDLDKILRDLEKMVSNREDDLLAECEDKLKRELTSAEKRVMWRYKTHYDKQYKEGLANQWIVKKTLEYIKKEEIELEKRRQLCVEINNEFLIQAFADKLGIKLDALDSTHLEALHLAFNHSLYTYGEDNDNLLSHTIVDALNKVKGIEDKKNYGDFKHRRDKVVLDTMAKKRR